MKNTALKIMHRLPAVDDRDTVGAIMNLSPRQSQYVVALPPGHAAVHADGMDRPILARMPYGEDREQRPAAAGLPPLAAVRSIACGPNCHTRPCTLREIDHAAPSAAEPRLALWIETAAIAHVIGRPEPVLQVSWLRTLTATDRHTLECVVGQLADDAIRRRHDALLEYYPPRSLAAHLAERARAWLDGRRTPCGEETHWQASSYRFTDVAQRLARPGHDPDRPHPMTETWIARGMDLRGMTAAAQLKAIRVWATAKSHDRTAIDGHGNPPQHALLAARLSHADTPALRFLDATRHLTFSTDWPALRTRKDRTDHLRPRQRAPTARQRPHPSGTHRRSLAVRRSRIAPVSRRRNRHRQAWPRNVSLTRRAEPDHLTTGGCNARTQSLARRKQRSAAER